MEQNKKRKEEKVKVPSTLWGCLVELNIILCRRDALHVAIPINSSWCVEPLGDLKRFLIICRNALSMFLMFFL